MVALDLSANQLQELDVQELPAKLRRLDIAGNSLVKLSSDLGALKLLQSIAAGCNQLTDADAIFTCTALVHASLCYNQLAELQCAPSQARPIQFRVWPRA